MLISGCAAFPVQFMGSPEFAFGVVETARLLILNPKVVPCLVEIRRETKSFLQPLDGPFRISLRAVSERLLMFLHGFFRMSHGQRHSIHAM